MAALPAVSVRVATIDDRDEILAELSDNIYDGQFKAIFDT
jgi:hypothetical protein